MAAIKGEASPSEKAVLGSGWSVYYIGTIRVFAYEIVVSSLSVNSGQRSNVASISPPPGHVDFSRLRPVISWIGNFSAHAVPGLDSGGFTAIGNQYAGGSLSFTGSLHIIAFEK